MKFWLFSLVSLGFFTQFGTSAQAAAVERPPQYVVFAFDGSRSIPMWQETRGFATAMKKAGTAMQFTYFINAAYYLAYRERFTYRPPHTGAGQSAIGFGDNAYDVTQRFVQTNMAASEKNEIANHAAGHFDGTHWNTKQWTQEFDQFYSILENIKTFNKIEWPPSFPKGWIFEPSAMAGFRAPQLGVSPGLYQAMATTQIKYDTSGVAQPTAWPFKSKSGLWNFPLAMIPIAGTTHKTLTMDYNFYYFHSRAKENPARSAFYEEQMYQSYVQYFLKNYNGNRAPLNIGHHFSLWNGGAYWRAMKRFAHYVCKVKEVKCTTYNELLAFIQLNEKKVATYQASAFKKVQPTLTASVSVNLAQLEKQTASAFASQTAGSLILEPLDESKLLIADPPEAHDESLQAPQNNTELIY